MCNLLTFRMVTLCLSLFVASSVNAELELQELLTTQMSDATTQVKNQLVSPGPHTFPLANNSNDVFIIAANGSNDKTEDKSIFYNNRINFLKLTRKSYTAQLSDYTNGTTPYFRGTYESIVKLTSEVEGKPELKPVVIYQFNEAIGDMVLLVNPTIHHLPDLCGKEIIAPEKMQSVGMISILNSAYTCTDKPTIKWASRERTIEALNHGTAVASFISVYSLLNANLDKSKYKVLLNDSVAPSASVDLLAVRSDFYNQRRYIVNNLVKGIEQSRFKIQTITNEAPLIENLDRLTSTMSIMMTRAESNASMIKEQLIHSANVRSDGNHLLFDRHSRGLFDDRVNMANQSLIEFGFIETPAEPLLGDMSDQLLLSDDERHHVNKLQSSTMSSIESTKKTMFTFSIEYDIGQTDFTLKKYAIIYNDIARLLDKFPGTSLVITGHADPIRFIRALENDASYAELNLIKQYSKNQSLVLAELVKNSLLDHLGMDDERINIVTFGKGLSRSNPTGCGFGVCKPTSWVEWKSNLRVVIDIVSTRSSKF